MILTLEIVLVPAMLGLGPVPLVLLSHSLSYFALVKHAEEHQTVC